MFKIRIGKKTEEKKQEILPPDKPEGFDERKKELFKFVDLAKVESQGMDKMIKVAGEEIDRIEEAHASLSSKMSGSMENARAKYLQLQEAEKAIREYAKKLDILYAKVTFEMQMWAQILGYHDKNRARALNLDAELYGVTTEKTEGDVSGSIRNERIPG